MGENVLPRPLDDPIELAHLLAGGVALGPQALHLLEKAAPMAVEAQDLVQRGLCVAVGESLAHGVGVLTNEGEA